MNRNKELGVWGEEKARAFLEDHGLTILDQGYSIGEGEVDLIARDGSCIVFFEVKTRRSDYFGHPVEAVTNTKQVRLAKAADHFLYKHKLEEEFARFDVLGILKQGKKTDILWIKDAFVRDE
ncbi:MAG: YraN family protein [Planctomycetota bacterium]|nr:YraN family protein [Planctomycetota bacterium]